MARLGLLAIGVSVAMAANSQAETPKAPLNKASGIPIDQLIETFQTNEIRARDSYVGKELTINGEVERVTISRRSRPGKDQVYVLELKTSPRAISSITANFLFDENDRDRLAKLKAGQVVVIQGRCGSPLYFSGDRHNLRPPKDYIEIPFLGCKLVSEK
jgi:hypothetical protein